MRFRLFFLGIIGLLTACGKEAGPVRLDFVGYTNLTSSDRTATAADSFRTHAFAQKGANDSPLTHFVVSVTYSPEPTPVVYPTLLTSFKLSTNSMTLTMLDSALTNEPSEFIIRPTFGARSTSGIEQWKYTVTNKDGQTATRSYRITVRKSDSLVVYHNYVTIPRILPGPLGRVYFALYPGLVLPRFAVHNRQENQPLVDLVADYSGGAISLQAPNSSNLHLPATWLPANRRATKLRRTSLDENGFNGVVTATDLTNAFEGATANATPNSSGSLKLKDVIAFKTDSTAAGDSKYGLLYISAISFTPVPVFTCTVRIQK